jgi:outer membrane protein OmpA-like peptidoglycan-associated protein
MMRKWTLIRILLLFAAIPLAVIAAGCGPAPAPRSRPLVIVATATANEPEATLGPTDLRRLRGNADTEDGKVLLVAPDGTVSRLPLTPRRDNGQIENGPRRVALIDANLAAVQASLATQTATGPFDLLEAINAALRAAGKPGTLLIVSSGLSVAGGMDLRQVLWGADPAIVAQQLESKGLLPSLTGWDVVFTGLGASTPPQPPLQTPQRRTLAAYWTTICQTADAASCAVNEEPRQVRPSHSSLPVPIVPIPQIESVRSPGGETTTSLPADTLFTFDSATPDPTARETLAPLAREIAARRLRVTVTGYASPDGGTPDYNRRLSLRRAESVVALLVALGVPRDHIDPPTGLGTDADPPDAGLTDGRIDPAKCAHLRRVVVVTRPTADPANP